MTTQVESAENADIFKEKKVSTKIKDVTTVNNKKNLQEMESFKQELLKKKEKIIQYT